VIFDIFLSVGWRMEPLRRISRIIPVTSDDGKPEEMTESALDHYGGLLTKYLVYFSELHKGQKKSHRNEGVLGALCDNDLDQNSPIPSCPSTPTSSSASSTSSSSPLTFPDAEIASSQPLDGLNEDLEVSL
jgi:hypothetical protein